jgi:hypothetical protein
MSCITAAIREFAAEGLVPNDPNQVAWMPELVSPPPLSSPGLAL